VVAAEEIVQDAFATLYRRWDRVESPSAYLRLEVVDRSRDALRRRRLARRVTFRSTEVRDHPDEVADAIARLPERQRTAVVLRFYEDLSIAMEPGVEGASGPRLSYTWVDGEGQLFLLTIVPAGASLSPSRYQGVSLRGTTAVVEEIGVGHFRVQWIEDGRTWDATGVTLPSPDTFSALLDGLEVLTPDVWTAQAPAGLADAIIAAGPDTAIGWNADEGIRMIWPSLEG
jgi:hypothetical protein